VDIKGNVAIVTGSSSGLGAAVARLLAAKGCHVVINYSKSEAAARETAEACTALGVETLICRADISDDSDCRRMAVETMDKWGRIDALVNNAGTTKFANPAKLDSLNANDFQRVYAVNLIGPYQMIRAVEPHMKAAGHGAVVNISSIAGVMGVGSSAAYAASKGALNTLTLVLARSLAPEIRVNAVCPGLITTGWMREGLGQERYDKLEAHIRETTPLRTASSPEDVAETVVWFIEGARHVTGEVLIVDAGMHLGYAPLVPR